MPLVFDAADSPVIQVEDIAAIPTDAWIDMKLHCHPTVFRADFSWNIVELWQAISDNQTILEPTKKSSTSWILWRNESLNQFRSLSVDEAWAIDSLLMGITFGELCEGLCQWVNELDAGLHAASLLKGWIQSGLITSVIH
jgi:hypothetical protein